MSTGQAKLLDSASGQVSFRYNMKYIYHCEYLVKEWDTQQYRYMENTCKIAKLQIRRWHHRKGVIFKILSLVFSDLIASNSK